MGVGCLLIHGFGGNINEVAPLARRLEKLGYTVACPSLKGHTGRYRDLLGCSHRDWIASAEQELERLKQQCEEIHVVGFSMGGLIAIALNQKHHFRSLVTLNTPIYYWDLRRVCINIADDIRNRKTENIRRYWDSSAALPPDALVHFRILLHKSKRLVPSITTPIFCVQALQDDTVRKKSANYIYDHTASKSKQLQFYDGSGHLILWSSAANAVIDDVTAFIQKCGQ